MEVNLKILSLVCSTLARVKKVVPHEFTLIFFDFYAYSVMKICGLFEGLVKQVIL